MALDSQSHDKAHTLEFNEKTHRYKLDGVYVPGVTTLIKATLPEGEGLITWRARQAAEYMGQWYGGLERQPTEKQVSTAVGESLTAYRRGLREAGEIGTALHDFIETYESGQIALAEQKLEEHCLRLPGASAGSLQFAVGAYRDYRANTLGSGHLDLIGAEGVVASAEFRFAGTFDRLHRREGKVVLSDFKTSKGIYLSQLVQLGAYAIAIKEWLGFAVDEFEILRFGKDGTFEPLTITDKSAILELQEQFIRCRQTYDVIKKYEAKRRC